MKRGLLFFFALFLLLPTGCDRGIEEQPDPGLQAKSPVPARSGEAPESEGATPGSHNLAYEAGENGRIEGVGSQIVEHGGAGSEVAAVPAEGYHFAGWNDGSKANPRTDAGVTADLAVKAIFDVNRYTLDYAAGAEGVIEGSASQEVTHGKAGSAVRVVPAEGYFFTGWSDGSTANPRTDAEVTADLSVTAVFTINRYDVSYSAGPGGTIDGVDIQEVRHGGTGKAVRAEPDEGYHFESWSDGSTANPRTDTGVKADLAVKAVFDVNRYTLSYSAGDNGSIDGAGRQVVGYREEGTPVTAVADRGYRFAGWSDGLADETRTDSMVTADLEVSAAFEAETYIVGGSMSGLAEGSRLTLQNNGGDDLVLVADGAFSFISELPDSDEYEVTVLKQPDSPSQTCTVSNGTGEVSGADVTTVSINCVLDKFAVGGKLLGLPEGSRILLRNNGGEDLVLSSDAEFSFPVTLGDGSAYDVTVHTPELKPKWFCRVENGAGVLAGSDVTDIAVACFPEAELQAKAGKGKIDLTWNSSDFIRASFNLCRAREEIPPDGFGRCNELAGGVLEKRINSPQTVSRLAYDAPYYFQIEVRHPDDRRTYSQVVNATPMASLNDTGIDGCADNGINGNKGTVQGKEAAGCKDAAVTLPGQDGHIGRDASARERHLKKFGHGSAGFDFTRICVSGEMAGEGRCPPNPSPGSSANEWGCTLDNVTGLVWEVKTADGLRGKENTYSWYNPRGTENGGEPGRENGGRCAGSGCDTRAYVDAVNKLGLCGASDWRVPNRKELLSIVNNGRFSPAIDTGYFPHTPASYFWTSSTYSEKPGAAWQVYFRYGEASLKEKARDSHLRLVRRFQ